MQLSSADTGTYVWRALINPQCRLLSRLCKPKPVWERPELSGSMRATHHLLFVIITMNITIIIIVMNIIMRAKHHFPVVIVTITIIIVLATHHLLNILLLLIVNHAQQRHKKTRKVWVETQEIAWFLGDRALAILELGQIFWSGATFCKARCITAAFAEVLLQISDWGHRGQCSIVCDEKLAPMSKHTKIQLGLVTVRSQ